MSGIRNNVNDVNECVRMFGGKLNIRQCIAISMEADCVPLLANLFYYEYNFVRGLIKTDINLAKRFSTTVRYIDNLLTLNIQEEITNIYMYPTVEEDY